MTTRPRMGQHRHASGMPFKWRFAGRPMMAHLKWYLDPPSLHHLKKLTLTKLSWTTPPPPPPTKITGSAHDSIRPGQQFFSNVWTGFPSMNRDLSRDLCVSLLLVSLQTQPHPKSSYRYLGSGVICKSHLHKSLIRTFLLMYSVKLETPNLI